MADSKITALTAISTVDPTADPLVIVDVSDTSMAASGTTKKSTINQLLGAGGTATLASATISGDLTVDTSTLKVDSANNRVGIGTASPTQALHVRGNILTGSAAGTDSFLNVTTDGVQNSLFGFNNSGSTNGYGASNNNTYVGSGNNYGLQIIGNSSVLASFSTSGVFNWYDGAGGTRMTLNSTGLGVGASPSERITVNSSTAANYIKLTNSGATTGFLIGCFNTAVDIRNKEAGAMNFFTSDTQRMTLDASGNLLVGTTSNSPGGTQSQFVNEWSGGVKWGSTFNQTVSSATAYTHIAFCTNGAVRGSIDANNTTITYGTVSDYRLKENVQPISNALTRIAALKPSTYKWKDSGTDGEGFIAHELAAVVPLAVVGQKDAVNEDGSIKAQQIDLSKVVPILVAAIQELTARVEALEA